MAARGPIRDRQCTPMDRNKLSAGCSACQKLTEDSGNVDWRQGKHSGMLFGRHGCGFRIMETKLQLLPVDERIRLVEDLWDSIAADQSALPLTADQKVELDRRLDAYAIDANRGQIAADVILNIRRRL
jgi:putative addiction module component (TIGR02574 family)